MIAEQSWESSLVCILDVLIFLKAYAFLGRVDCGSLWW